MILGGEKERAEAETLAEGAEAGPVIACGKTSLLETAVLLRRSRALVTTDSGPMHLGFALGVPTVALFGPEDFRDYGVGGDEERIAFLMGETSCARPCKKKTCDIEGHPCMASIGVEMVLEAVRDRIASPAVVPE